MKIILYVVVLDAPLYPYILRYMLQPASTYSYEHESNVVLTLELGEVLSSVCIDDYEFLVTLHPSFNTYCVLWFRDTRVDKEYDALGRFTCFDKRDVLLFITRYTTNPELRREVDNRRFERRISGWTREFMADIRRRSHVDEEDAFRNLFDLDREIDRDSLAKRRRIMARKFHPDAGGDGETMSLINRAYEHLAEKITA